MKKEKKKPKNLSVVKLGISSLKSGPSHLHMRVYSHVLQTAPPQKIPYWKISNHHLDRDSDLRARIYERYLHCGDSRYKHELPDMLLKSASSVFTHGDIAPRNIMVDENGNITGIIDWEWAGWYPDYWEYAQIMRPAFWGDWFVWMGRTAPEKWDLAGVNDARKVLF